MLLYCPYPVETRAPRHWSWGLKLAVIGVSVLAACLCIRWPDADRIMRRLSGEAPRVPSTFRVADFVAEPQVAVPGGRAQPTVLPVALPSRFDLTVEVRAIPDDLPSIRIAGMPLGLPRPRGRASDRIHQDESWHRVRLCREEHRVSVFVDGESISIPPTRGILSDWLTIEPAAERPAIFRNLVVTW
jgi:hypothetical protein